MGLDGRSHRQLKKSSGQGMSANGVRQMGHGTIGENIKDEPNIELMV